jgi:hypothetical protein
MRGISPGFEVVLAAVVAVGEAGAPVVVGVDVVEPNDVVVFPAVVVAEPDSPQATRTRVRANERRRIRRIHRG